MDGIQLYNFYFSLLSDNSFDEHDWVKFITDVYADGFVDQFEQSLIIQISKGDRDIDIPDNIRSAAKIILGDQLWTKSKYEMMLRENDIDPESYYHPSSQRNGHGSLLDYLEKTEQGHWQLGFRFYSRKKSLLFNLILPDETGRDEFNLPISSSSNNLSSYVKARLAEDVLVQEFNAADTQEKWDEIDAALVSLSFYYDAVDLGIYDLSERHEKAQDINQIVIEQALESEERVDFRNTEILGKIPEGYIEDLDDAFQILPDYVQAAIHEQLGPIYAFDSSQLYTELLDEEVVSEPQAKTFWVQYNEETNKSDMYLETEGKSESSVVHELGHVITDMIPSYYRHLAWGSFGIGRLFQEKLKAIKHSAEEVFTTRYQADSVLEDFAEAFLIFYTDKISSGYVHTGSIEELRREEPRLYLVLESLDTLLEAHYGDLQNDHAAPMWAAFSETNLARIDEFLEEHPDNWSDEENLARFRDNTLSLDISDEAIIWIAMQESGRIYFTKTYSN